MMIKMVKYQVLVIELELDMAERNFSPKEKSVIIVFVVITVIKTPKRFEGAIRPNSFGYPLRGLRAHWVRN